MERLFQLDDKFYEKCNWFLHMDKEETEFELEMSTSEGISFNEDFLIE